MSSSAVTSVRRAPPLLLLTRANVLSAARSKIRAAAATPTHARPLSSSSDAAPVERLRDESVLAHIVCPISKYPLRYDAERGRLVCDEIHVAYPIRHGAPMLVPSEAKIIDQDEQEQ